LKILVVAAHRDDEIIGIGGTICKHIKNGDEINICVVTRGFEPEWSNEYNEIKDKEQKEIDEFLGIKDRIKLELPSAKLNTIPHGELNQKISEIVDKVQPDILYTHFEHDIHYDHTMIFRACMVATRPPKHIMLLCFETLSETEWNNKAFKPNIWNDITGCIDKKIEAFKIYESEVREPPHPRSEEGIRTQARMRGMEACMDYAEAFMLIRDFW